MSQQELVDPATRKPRSIGSQSIATRTSSLFWRRTSNPFTISLEQLSKLSDEQDHGRTLEALGGINSVAKILLTNLEKGIHGDMEQQILTRKRVFGENRIPDPPRKTYLRILFETLQDTTLVVLCVAASVSLALSFVHLNSVSPCEDFDANNPPQKKEKSQAEFLEALAILVAVAVVANVTAMNDYSKEKQFRKLNEASRNTNHFQVVRAGERLDVQSQDIVVGDVVMISAGDKIPADGLFIAGQTCSCDESALTGEPDLQKKKSGHYLKADSLVAEGFGQMLVTSVGEHTDSGKAQALLKAEEPEPTPLQAKLETMATQIGKLGFSMAVVTFISLVIRFVICRTGTDEAWNWDELKVILNFLILGITIIVVAIPEGLPLAVTISLAYSMRRMMADQNLVRKLAACETMGGATNICSDKTGTLTENRMSVTEGIVFGKLYKPVPRIEEISHVTQSLLSLLLESLSANTLDASYVSRSPAGNWDYKGNKTECALLALCCEMGGDFVAIRDEIIKAERRLRVMPFDSNRKRMTTVIQNGKFVRAYTKGAGEIVTGMCTRVISETGDIVPMTSERRSFMQEQISRLTRSGLRTICVCYTDLTLSISGTQTVFDVVNELPPEQIEKDLILLALIGIKDPVRKEVPPAVASCKRAGIFVRMVTGDNIETARHIARECGILDDNGLAMEGDQFRVLTHEQMVEILPRLQVLARSKPTDKFILVNKLKELGEVVAVTGDGTNDAPALKAADVGLAMGITGTDVAKKASDIVILDDNFASIVRSVMWGRNVYDSIRKFLQFQLSVNVCALMVAYIGAVVNSKSPLAPVQLLWVNLIMDTMAALALATEVPTIELLDRKPYGRFESLVSKRMWLNIFGQAFLQITILLIMLFEGENIYFTEHESSKQEKNYTMVFNTFVFLQVFNEINCRVLNRQFNVFKGIFSNFLFVIVIFLTVLLQALIVQFGGNFFKTKTLSAGLFFLSSALGLLAFPIAALLKFVTLPGEPPLNAPKSNDSEQGVQMERTGADLV
eukprot:c8989_g1_i2.p1 GENE.c8989_g1_i2~~c8989_g1_i2.p1  ORF type:complete len:1021 (+),score=210.29 c8989_g1_i2:44-3106(+)